MNLIKPIKSLADNWGINIASELEMYLDELSNVIVSLDGVISSTADNDDINNDDDDDDNPHLPMKSSKRKKKVSKMFSFAEAALIIQGSAMVYTKKVDFLHQLVVTTLKLLREKTAATDISGKRKRNIEDDETIHGDSEKRARTGTNMGNEGDEDDDFMLLDDCIPSISLKSTNNFQISKENDQNMMNRNLLKKMPFSLSMGQSLSSSLTHCIDPFSGALLMNSFEKYDPKQDKISTYDNQDALNNNNPDQYDGNENPSFGYGDYDGGGDYGNDGDDDNNGEEYQHGLNAKGNRNSDGISNSNGLSSKEIDDAKHNFMNVWKYLDMNESSSARDRPFKRGNTLRIPEYGASVSGVGDGQSTIKQQAKRKGVFAMFSQTSFPEFQYLSKRYHMTLSKKLSSGDGDSHSVIINNEIFSRKLAPFVTGDNDGRPYLGDRQHDFDDYDGGGDGYFGGYDDYDEHNNNNTGDEANLPNIKGLNLSNEKDEKQNMNSIESLHLNNMQKQFRNLQLFSGLDDDDDILPHENQAYIELVRSHVDQYIQMAQKWACNSKLAQTVHDWVKKIDPILEEEENRVPYDIHEYGDMVLDSAELKNSVPFSDIVQHCAPIKEESSDDIHPSIHIPKYEVGRLFLATLQLANDRKIEIDVSDSTFNVKRLV